MVSEKQFDPEAYLRQQEMMKDPMRKLEDELGAIITEMGNMEFAEPDVKMQDSFKQKLEGMRIRKQSIIEKITALLIDGKVFMNERRRRALEAIKNSQNPGEDVENIYSEAA